MRAKKVTLWYCDHCGARKFTRPAMEKHEAGCTANINRRCGHCEAVGNSTTPFHDMIATLGGGSDAEFEALVELVEGCPACIQTAIRWWRDMIGSSPNHELINNEPYDGPGYPYEAGEQEIDKWRYQDAAGPFWEGVNDAKYENVAYDY